MSIKLWNKKSMIIPIIVACVAKGLSRNGSGIDNVKTSYSHKQTDIKTFLRVMQ